MPARVRKLTKRQAKRAAITGAARIIRGYILRVYGPEAETK